MILLARFNIKRILVSTQLTALVNKPVQKVEAAIGIQTHAIAHNLGVTIVNWDPLVIPRVKQFCVKEFAFETMSELEELVHKKRVDELPTMVEFKKFRILEAIIYLDLFATPKSNKSHLQIIKN